MGFFKYSTTFPMIKFDFCRTLGILKGQIEDKNISFSGARTHESTTYISRAEMKKKIVQFLVQMKTIEFTYEIIWPLGDQEIWKLINEPTL